MYLSNVARRGSAPRCARQINFRARARIPGNRRPHSSVHSHNVDSGREAGEFRAAEQAAAIPEEEPQHAIELPPGAELIESPMVGSVWKINVAPGQRVRAGDVLLILEAMKMEVPIHAPEDGTVLQVACKPGQMVTPGSALCIFTSAESAG